MLVTYDPGEDIRQDPLVTEADVTGLYTAGIAVIASRSTTTGGGTEVYTDDWAGGALASIKADRQAKGEFTVLVAYDPGEDVRQDPLVAEADILGLYTGDRAAASSKWTSTIGDDGTGDLDD